MRYAGLSWVDSMRGCKWVVSGRWAWSWYLVKSFVHLLAKLWDERNLAQTAAVVEQSQVGVN